MNGDDGELTISEKRAIAAQARWNANHHPLFSYAPGEKAEAVAWISIQRQTDSAGGAPVDCPRTYAENEIESPEALQSFFGGGLYLVDGRRAGPDGRPGAVVKRQRFRFVGPTKPFPGEVAQTPPAAAAPAAAPTSDPMTAFLQIMAQDRAASEAREERRIQREEARAAQSQNLLATLLSAGVGLVTTFVNRPIPQAAPTPDAGAMFATAIQTVMAIIPRPEAKDPLDSITRILDVADKIRPPAKPEQGDSIGDLMQGLAGAMGNFAQLEELRQRAAASGLPGAMPMPGTEEPPPPPPAPTSNGQTDRAPPMPEANGHDALEMAS